MSVLNLNLRYEHTEIANKISYSHDANYSPLCGLMMYPSEGCYKVNETE